ncbi:MAG TPA: M14 family zinc carboxypeptidase [Bacteroidia bacterium]|nr:M14 family zinc carboxypeptidase [Bacteroidia bacterium]HNT79199.1 M14 family zinc carboxypeptidase [Bacteroidia bacterium]
MALIRFTFFLSILFLNLKAFAQFNEHMHLQNKSATYEESMDYYQGLSEKYSSTKFIDAGISSNGSLIGLFVIDAHKEFSAAKSKSRGKIVLLINNGIHPGEPDGIDASMIFTKELLTQKKYAHLLEHITFCIVPVFNVDGSVNRSCCSRVNQNGPEEYGFRANDQYLDLNRDFIKMDSENAKTFVSIFQQWNPDVFIDTHVSNGADYTYNMTLITSQSDKMAPELSPLLRNKLEPFVYVWMKSKNDPIVPYINTEKWSYPPDSGLYAFIETPRYATGYTALYHSVGFVTEAHMLKPFPQRVESTLNIIQAISEMCVQYRTEILTNREQSFELYKMTNWIPIAWKVDVTRSTPIDFAGYTASYKPSTISGKDRLYYDRSKPYNKKIKYFPYCTAIDSVSKPIFYIIPQAWRSIIDRLKYNQVPMFRLSNDSSMVVEVYHIKDFKTTENPFEGHYLHYNTITTSSNQRILFRKGDYIIPMGQNHDRFVCEVLEPRATDSYFNWGFFDAILQQKEWYSDYVFEDIAAELLEQNPELKKSFTIKLENDSSFKSNPFMRLYYVYQNSPYFEKGFKRYPVYRFMGLLDE